MNEDLQVEAGNYTRIVNKVIEELVKTPLLGAELAICLFIIRKTYGFNKKEDEISLTQFEKATNRSRPTIVKALKNLQLVNVVKLVKTGDSRKQSNLWAFNKYYESWKLVKRTKLVKKKTSTSKEIKEKLVKGGKHTKDILQKTTKDIAASAALPVNEFITLFREVNPSYESLFSNRTQRSASERILKTHGIDAMRKTLSIIEKTNEMQYAPVITTPLELEKLGGKLKAFIAKEKSLKVKNNIVVI